MKLQTSALFTLPLFGLALRLRLLRLCSRQGVFENENGPALSHFVRDNLEIRLIGFRDEFREEARSCLYENQ
jgi:hypothetical protein